MNKKIKSNYEALAQSTGLRFDTEGGALYGERGAFQVTVSAVDANHPYLFVVMISAQRPGGVLTKEECRQFQKENKPVANLGQNGYLIRMSLKATTNQSKLLENLNASLNALVNFLRASGFQNCCQTCGKPESDVCCVSGSYAHLCPDCFASVQQNKTMDYSRKQRKNENILGGIVGALLGTLLGVLCIIILSQLGYVAALSGVVMAVCTLKGYELLGGKLTKKGIVISIILMLVMTYVGDQIDWAIMISRELQLDFVASFQAFPFFLQQQIIPAASYWGNLALLYLFLLLGAVPTVINTLKNQKNEGNIYRLGRTPQNLE